FTLQPMPAIDRPRDSGVFFPNRVALYAVASYLDSHEPSTLVTLRARCHPDYCFVFCVREERHAGGCRACGQHVFETDREVRCGVTGDLWQQREVARGTRRVVEDSDPG